MKITVIKTVIAMFLVSMIMGCATHKGSTKKELSATTDKVFYVPAPQQGDDWLNVQTVLNQALKAGKGAKVVFSEGTYDFSQHKHISGGWHLNLNNVNDLVIDGNGATLLMHPSNSFVSIRNCKRVEVKNFTLHYTMPHHVQGDIVEVADDYSTIVVKPHNGYAYSADFPADEEAPELEANLFILDSKVNQLKRVQLMGNDHLKQGKYDIIEDKHLIRFHILPRYSKRIKSLEVGDRLVTHAFYGTQMENMLVRRSSDCLLENITAHSSGGMNVRPANNEGLITLRKIINKPRPDSNNIVSTIRDGIHCRSNRGPLLIEECYFEGMMDDSINIFSLGFACKKLTDDGGLVMGRSSHGEPYDYFRPNDKVILLDRTSGCYLTELTVKKSVPHSNNPNAELIRGFTLYFNEPLPEGIVFGKADGRGATEVYNVDASGAGSIVRKNTFMPQRRHALLFSAPNVSFTDNIVDGIHGSAVRGETQGFFICGPIPSGAVIKNNIIKNTGWEAISFKTNAVGGKVKINNSPAKDIIINNNTIEYKYNDAIKLVNVNGASLENNTITASSDVQEGKKAINLINSITIKND